MTTKTKNRYVLARIVAECDHSLILNEEVVEVDDNNKITSYAGPIGAIFVNGFEFNEVFRDITSVEFTGEMVDFRKNGKEYEVVRLTRPTRVISVHPFSAPALLRRDDAGIYWLEVPNFSQLVPQAFPNRFAPIADALQNLQPNEAIPIRLTLADYPDGWTKQERAAQLDDRLGDTIHKVIDLFPNTEFVRQ